MDALKQIGNRDDLDASKQRRCQETILPIYLLQRRHVTGLCGGTCPLHRKNRTPRRARKRQKSKFDSLMSAFLFGQMMVAHVASLGIGGDLMLFEQRTWPSKCHVAG